MKKHTLLILFLLISILCVPLCAQSVSDTPEDDENVNYEPSEIIDDTLHSGYEGHTHSDTTSIAKKEGGSANRGINFLYYENMLNTGMPVLQFVDTIAHNVHRYRPIEKGDIFRVDRGNYGMITQETEYNPSFSINRTFGHSPYDLYRFSPENSPFYQGRNPYAEIFYVFGLSKDQYFNGLFTMNLWRGLNIGGQYRTIASPGRYSHQRSSHNNARFFVNYISRNQRYIGKLAYYFNKFQLNENGGINIDFNNLASVSSTESNVPIRLQDAENAWSEHNVFMKNSYLIGWGRVDTLPYTGFNFGWLSHTFKFQQEKRIYNDKSIPAGYYDTCYLNKRITLDTILNRRIENTIAYSFGDVTDYKSRYWVNIYAGVRHVWRNQIYDTLWHQYDSILLLDYQKHNLDVRAAIRLALFKQVHISADATYDVLRNHSITASGKIEYFFNQKHINDTIKHSKVWQDCINWDKSKDKIWLTFNYYDKSPNWFQRRYISNNYIWFNQFRNEKNIKFEAGLDFWGMKISLEHSLLKDYIYMERDGFKQADEMFQVLKIVFEKNFKIWLICLDNRVVVQKVWNDKFMHLPLLSTKNAFYFDFVLARWTPTQIGIEMTYNTKYYADFYHPALQSFYVQTEFQTGNFFNVNAFIDLRVKRANVFLKVENLLGSWLQKNNYWYTAGYPTYSLWFKIGILWRFYD